MNIIRLQADSYRLIGIAHSCRSLLASELFLIIEKHGRIKIIRLQADSYKLIESILILDSD